MIISTPKLTTPNDEELDNLILWTSNAMILTFKCLFGYIGSSLVAVGANNLSLQASKLLQSAMLIYLLMCVLSRIQSD